MVTTIKKITVDNYVRFIQEKKRKTIKRRTVAKYLGCKLNYESDIGRELNKRKTENRR